MPVFFNAIDKKIKIKMGNYTLNHFQKLYDKIAKASSRKRIKSTPVRVRLRSVLRY